jgi:hypothetical protein
MPGQLNLFAGKRQRGRQPPPPKEFAIHCVMADIIKRWINPVFRFTHMPMGEAREHRINPKTGKRYSLSGQRLQRMGVTPDWPDFLFVGPGLIAWVELKRERFGKPSEGQTNMEAHLRACGHHYLITSDVKEATAWLVELGILRGITVQ